MYFARLAAAGKLRSVFVTFFMYFSWYPAIWDLVSGFMRMRVYCAGAAPNNELRLLL